MELAQFREVDWNASCNGERWKGLAAEYLNGLCKGEKKIAFNVFTGSTCFLFLQKQKMHNFASLRVND